MDRSVAQATAISQAIREDVAEGLSPWVDLTPHHPLDRIVAGVRIGVAPSPRAAVAHISQAGSRTAVP